jgi:hypothetical protein
MPRMSRIVQFQIESPARDEIGLSSDSFGQLFVEFG